MDYSLLLVLFAPAPEGASHILPGAGRDREFGFVVGIIDIL
jgi:hypothetical protein